MAAKFLPPNSPDPRLEAFFDTWVYGTGVPEVKLRYSISGMRISGTIEQRGVAPDFSASVPVEVFDAHGKSSVHWVDTGSDPVSFAWTMHDRPVRAAVDASGALVTIQE